MVKRSIVKENRIVVEGTQERRWRLAQVGPGARNHRVPAVEPPDLVRQHPAAVREQDLDAGQLLHDTAEDQPDRGDRRLDRIADEIVEEILPEALAADLSHGRVQEYQHIEVAGEFPERPELLVVGVTTVDVRADLEAPQPEGLHG